MIRGLSLHRRRLNRALRSLTPLTGRVLEIGNGRVRRGIWLGASWTLDWSQYRQPSVQGDAMALPFCADALTGVICCETLQYIPTPALALKEMRRVLTPGGRLLLSVPWSTPRDSVGDRWRWNDEEICRDLRKAGFVVKDIIHLRRWLDAPSGMVVEAVAG